MVEIFVITIIIGVNNTRQGYALRNILKLAGFFCLLESIIFLGGKVEVQ